VKRRASTEPAAALLSIAPTGFGFRHQSAEHIAVRIRVGQQDSSRCT
jgi:hypothetical protein